ncbi:MAG: EamA family transporter [Nitrospina sp.]|nr:EamA family transporter [Nitrospina sp.]MBT6716124.1 EamA family transporter [Nitrospina sp.]
MAIENISLILISSILHSFWNILTQTSKNSQFFSGLKGIWIILMAIVALNWIGFSIWNRELLFWGILSGIVHGVYILCLSRAYKTQDISYVYPIARSAPVFVPVFAWLLLGEKLTPITLLAILIIISAIYILHFDGHLIKGFRNLWHAIQHNDLRWAFYTLITVVSYSLIDKRGMDIFIQQLPDQPFINGLAFFFMEATIGFILCNFYLFSNHAKDEILELWRNEWLKGLMAALATLGSYGLICVVLQFELVSAVVSLRQVSVLMVVFWGCWKLGEPFGNQRLLAGGLIIFGIFLIGR